MSRFYFACLFIFLGVLGLFPLVSGGVGTTTFTWDHQTLGYDDLTLTATRCQSVVGNQDLNVTVHQRPGTGVSLIAVVTGTMYKPLGGTDSLSFTNLGDGNYNKTYNFTQAGTYKLVLHSTDTNYTPGDLNEYIYVQDFDFNISFSNNNFSVASGSTGTIQNYVKNSDNNAVTGLSGRIDANYPDGTPFVNNGIISETGSGYYYYSFTAPATAGIYSAASSFVCGPNTDTNNQGRFTVTVAGSGGSGSSGSGGNGTSGSAGGGGGGGGVSSSAKPFDAVVLSHSFLGALEIGTPTQLQLVMRNIGKNGSRFLIKATISQAEKPEWTTTQLSPFILSNSTIDFSLDSNWQPLLGGSHVVKVEVFADDGAMLLSTYAKSFALGGLLRYDVVATCLDKSVVAGQDVSAQLNLLNLGDYYQDIKFSWWVTGQEGKKIGESSFPLALYRDESRSLVRSVTLPKDASPGEYQFHAQLDYNSTLVQGNCAFSIVAPEKFYVDKAAEYRNHLAELNEIIKLKGGATPAIRDEVVKITVLLDLFDESIRTRSYETAATLDKKLAAALAQLSTDVLAFQPAGFFDGMVVRIIVVLSSLIGFLLIIRHFFFKKKIHRQVTHKVLRLGWTHGFGSTHSTELGELSHLHEKEKEKIHGAEKEAHAHHATDSSPHSSSGEANKKAAADESKNKINPKRFSWKGKLLGFHAHAKREAAKNKAEPEPDPWTE